MGSHLHRFYFSPPSCIKSCKKYEAHYSRLPRYIQPFRMPRVPHFQKNFATNVLHHYITSAENLVFFSYSTLSPCNGIGCGLICKELLLSGEFKFPCPTPLSANIWKGNTFIYIYMASLPLSLVFYSLHHCTSIQLNISILIALGTPTTNLGLV